MKRQILAMWIAGLLFPSLVTEAESAPKWYIDNLQSGWSKSNYERILPGNSKQHLNKKINNDIQLEVMNTMMPNNRIAIVSHKGNIVSEVWRTSKNIKPGGNSMTKSILSLAVGKAVCEGKINLDNRASSYASVLRGTSWGDATVEELLKMSSGAHRTMDRYAGHKDKDMRDRSIKILKKTDNFTNMTAFLQGDDRYREPGSAMIYSNADSIALGYVLEAATKKSFAKYFTSIWHEVGAEKSAHMMVNNKGEPYYHAGFAATPYDYIRLGNFVLNRMKTNDCFGNYLKKATTEQIDYPAFADNRDYGYHIWTDCMIGERSFCFVGFSGQYLLVYPKHDLVLYVHSTSEKWGGYVKWSLSMYNISKGL